jgi:hypothetical protein
MRKSNPRGRRKGWVSLYEAEGTGVNAFLLVDNATGREVIIQSDWDFPGVASSFGWVPCRKCRATDGTVDCAHRTASEMISEAYDYLMAHLGKQIPDPGYFYESNPRRPTREFMQRCMRGVGPGYDPGAVCGSQWYHKMTAAQKRKWLARENPVSGPRRRSYRRNPDYSKIKGFEPWMAQNPQFVQAVNKYVEFHGTMPASIKAKDVPGLGSREDVQFLVHMGKAMDTTYKPTHKKSTKFGSSYIHEFGEDLGRKPKDDELPDQVCTPDGKGILTFGGRFEVKDWVRK